MKRLPTAADDGRKRDILELADTPEARKLKVKLAAGYRLLGRYGLDRSCDINLRAMATGRPLQRVPPEAARQARELQKAPTRWPFQWFGLIMELNRYENDYDPQGWLPAHEVPSIERLQAALSK